MIKIMSLFREHQRVTAFLLALTFVAVSTKGLCLMPAAGSGKGGAHDCCRKGWQTAPPGCCMDGRDGTAATVAARVVAPGPAVATAPPLGATAPSALLVCQIVVNTDRVHSPPPRTILRV